MMINEDIDCVGTVRKTWERG